MDEDPQSSHNLDFPIRRRLVHSMAQRLARAKQRSSRLTDENLASFIEIRWGRFYEAVVAKRRAALRAGYLGTAQVERREERRKRWWWMKISLEFLGEVEVERRSVEGIDGSGSTSASKSVPPPTGKIRKHWPAPPPPSSEETPQRIHARPQSRPQLSAVQATLVPMPLVRKHDASRPANLPTPRARKHDSSTRLKWHFRSVWKRTGFVRLGGVSGVERTGRPSGWGGGGGWTRAGVVRRWTQPQSTSRRANDGFISRTRGARIRRVRMSVESRGDEVRERRRRVQEAAVELQERKRKDARARKEWHVESAWESMRSGLGGDYAVEGSVGHGRGGGMLEGRRREELVEEVRGFFGDGSSGSSGKRES